MTKTPEVDEERSAGSNSDDDQLAEEYEVSNKGNPANQAEAGLKFDYGEIDDYVIIDGHQWIWFDRWSFNGQEGLELESEPRTELASDFEGAANPDSRLRSYRIAFETDTLMLEPKDEQNPEFDRYESICDEPETKARFLGTNLNTLSQIDGPVSLTFDKYREVTLVRDMRTC